MDVLKSTYKCTYTLLQYISSFCGEEAIHNMLHDVKVQPPEMQYCMAEVMICTDTFLNIPRPCDVSVYLSWSDICENVRCVKLKQMESESLSGVQNENDVLPIPFPICLSHILHSQQWRELHLKIGTTLMRKILLSASIFVKHTEKQIYVQVCGMPPFKLQGKVKTVAKKFIKNTEREVPLLSNKVFMQKMRKLSEKRRGIKRKILSANNEDLPPAKKMKDDVTDTKKKKKIRKSHKIDVPVAIQELSSCITSPYNPSWPFYSIRLCYSRNFREMWPDIHLLSLQPADEIGASVVAKSIITFDVGVQMTKDNIGKLIQYIPELTKYSLMILTSHKSFRYRDHYRKIIKGSRENKTAVPVVIISEDGTSNLHETRITRVFAFVDFILRQVIPLQLFGSVGNRKLFCGFVKHYLSAGRFETFTVAQVMYKIKVREVEWLSSLNDNKLRQYVVSRVLMWLLLNYVVVAVRSFFYVTETCYKRNELKYYPKQVWQKVSDKAMKKLVDSKQFRSATDRQIQEINKRCYSPGKSILRFLPKKNNVRHILILLEKALSREQMTNQQYILGLFCKKVEGSLKLGNGNIFLEKWRKLYNEWDRNGRPPLYYVKVDTRNAFGSVKQPLLEKILLEHQKQLPSPEKVQVDCYYGLRFNGKAVTKKPVNLIVTCADDLIKENWMPETVVVKAYKKHDIDVTSTIRRLIKLILFHVVSNGKQSLIMRQGIAQGGSLSSLLCNLYYGHMDEHALKPFLNGKGELFMRSVDDYIYITQKVARAKEFLTIMSHGIEEYGCTINGSKTISNVRDNENTDDAAIWITFCGFQFNMTTMKTRGDYDSYQDQNIRHTMNINCTKAPGRFVVTRMMCTSMLKLQPILLDLHFNDRHQLYFNILRAFLMAAYRFHALVKVCFFHREKFPAEKNPSVFIAAIVVCGKQTWKTIAKQKKCFQLECKEEYITRNEVFLLLYNAFILKLKRHSGMYGGVLRCLNKLKRNVSGKVPIQQKNIINTICNEGLPQTFIKIK